MSPTPQDCVPIRLPRSDGAGDSPGAAAHRVVVLGHGMVGHRFVAEVMRRSGAAPVPIDVTVLGAEPYEPYNRLLLSEVLAGRADVASLTLPQAPAGVRVLTRRAALRLERQHRVVLDDTGERHPYDTVVCALGAAPRVPRLRGLPRDVGPDGLPAGVQALRTVDDARALLARVACRRPDGHPPRVVVLGGGLLGLEAARALLGRGARVAIVHSGGHVLDRQLSAQPGAVLGARLRDLGVTIVRDARAAGLRRDDHGALVGLDLADGRQLPCDTLLLTAGVAPRVDLAAAAGLSVDSGILVDAALRSPDDPDVAAIGDCAQTDAGCPGLLAPGWDQAAALAEQLVARLTREAAAGPPAETSAGPSIVTPTDTRSRTDSCTYSCTGRDPGRDPKEVVRLKAADLDVVTFGRMPRGESCATTDCDAGAAATPTSCAMDPADDLAGWAEPQDASAATDERGRCARHDPTGTRVITLHDPTGRRSLHLAVRGDRPLGGDRLLGGARLPGGDRQRGDRLLGGILVGAGALAADLVSAYERETPLPLDPAQLLVAGGGSALPTRTSPANIPGAATICRCNGVTKSAIITAFEAGERTLPHLAEATRATTGCGSCTSACRGILAWLEQADPQQADPQAPDPQQPEDGGPARARKVAGLTP